MPDNEHEHSPINLGRTLNVTVIFGLICAAGIVGFIVWDQVVAPRRKEPQVPAFEVVPEGD